MKRKDMTPGKTYGVSNSRDWPRLGRTREMMLVDAGTWAKIDGYRTVVRTEHTALGEMTVSNANRTPRGTHVLMRPVDAGPDTPAWPVPSSHVRGEWAESLAAEDDARREEQEREAANERAREGKRERTRAVLDRASAVLGREVKFAGTANSGFAIPTPVLLELIALAEEAKAK